MALFSHQCIKNKRDRQSKELHMKNTDDDGIKISKQDSNEREYKGITVKGISTIYPDQLILT